MINSEINQYTVLVSQEWYDYIEAQGYDMTYYKAVEPLQLSTPTQPTTHYKHYMKFQKAKRKS